MENIIVSVRETIEDNFLDILNKRDTPFLLLGHVTRGDIRIDDKSFGNIDEYVSIYQNTLSSKLEQ